jgi:ferredoxin
MRFAEEIVEALGYQGEHFRLVDGTDVAALDRSLWDWPAALGVRVPATFAAVADKRTTAALAIEHLLAHAPTPQRVIALSSGAPFGAIAVDRDACTMCMACVGACPVGAIGDSPETPQLRFVESKCVQCGICEKTCPERAIALSPRLDLTPEAKTPRVLNEAAIVQCIRCGKPLGAGKMVERMIDRLAGHSMFAAPGALDRLRMCADCRILDMMKDELGA